MKPSRKAFSPWRRVRRAGLCGVALAFIVPACTDDAIVYPNRSLKAPSGEAGALAAAGEGGGAGTGADADAGGARARPDAGGDTGMSGESGTAGADIGPRCGDGIVQPPEQCDDGNTKSGDGCSSTCQSSCEKCEKNVCVPDFTFSLDSVAHPDGTVDTANHNPYDLCYKGTGTIKRGPGAGESRNAACRLLVDCIHQTDCAQTKGPNFTINRCLCDHDFTDPKGGAIKACETAQAPDDPDPLHPQNPNGFIPGACYDDFQQASETDTPTQAFNALSTTGSAAGAALWLTQACDARLCPEECLPSYFEHGIAATITADLDTALNEAGESPVGDLVADAQRSIAQADIALVGGYFFTSSLETKLAYEATPFRDADAPGRVLWSEARALVASYGETGYSGLLSPSAAVFNDVLFKVNFTGKQISDALERQLDPATGAGLQVSGLGYTWDASKPVGSRLVEVHTLPGTPLDKSASYSVAASTAVIQSTSPYTSLHAANPTAVPNVDLFELLGEYLSQLPQPVSPPTLDRITRIGG